MNGSAFWPARTRRIPAIVRVLGSGEASALTSTRPAAREPGRTPHGVRRKEPGSAEQLHESILAFRLEHGFDVVPIPVCRVMGCEVVKPNRQDILVNSGIGKLLSATVSVDHQVEMDAHRDNFSDQIELRRVLGPVYRTARQHHAAHPRSGLWFASIATLPP